MYVRKMSNDVLLRECNGNLQEHPVIDKNVCEIFIEMILVSIGFDNIGLMDKMQIN